jgi:UPF0042 nucleotide-binding protein
MSRSTVLSPEVQAAPSTRIEDTRPHRVLVMTGMSGAGKTTALKALEDLGYECVDHVPIYLLFRLLRPSAHEPFGSGLPLAVGVDVRTRDFSVDACLGLIDGLKADATVDVRVVFLFCDDEELRRRYSVTRHRHPLAVGLPLVDGIARERQMLWPLRLRADLTIDTTSLAPGDLKRMLEGSFGAAGAQAEGMGVQVTSFSFRSGLPREADLVFDVRFLANPHYDPQLMPLTGKDSQVAAYVAADPNFAPFFASLKQLLEPLLPRYAAEGKSYLTIAIGCTGGRHRSVYIAEQLGAWLATLDKRVQVHHRDLNRSNR